MGVEQKTAQEIEIKTGLRQGCIFSPTLFNFHSETYEIKIKGFQIDNLRYADDTVLSEEALQVLQILMNNVVDVFEEHRL